MIPNPIDPITIGKFPNHKYISGLKPTYKWFVYWGEKNTDPITFDPITNNGTSSDPKRFLIWPTATFVKCTTSAASPGVFHQRLMWANTPKEIPQNYMLEKILENHPRTCKWLITMVSKNLQKISGKIYRNPSNLPGICLRIKFWSSP